VLVEDRWLSLKRTGQALLGSARTIGVLMTKTETKEEQARFILRLPARLDHQLKRDAQTNHRSKNGHILHLLEKQAQRSATGAGGGDYDEQVLLNWFRGLSESRRVALVTFLQTDQE